MDALQKLSVISKKQVAFDIYEIILGLGKEGFTFKPGQYIHLSLPSLKYPDPRGNGRDFSIASSPNDKHLALAFKNTGSGFKKTLLEVENVKVEIDGPFGRFTLPKDSDQKFTFIASGIGVTPFLSMVKFATEEKLSYKITLLYTASSKQKAVFLHKLLQLEKENPNFELKTHFGTLTNEIIQEEIKDKSSTLFYLSGAPQRVFDIENILLSLGVQRKNILKEEFTGYWGDPMNNELSKRPYSDLEALLQALNNTAIVSEANAEGIITFVNDKFVEISKYSKDELIGQNHRILKSGFHSKPFYENMWATIARGRLWRGQIKNKAKDGSFYWVDTSIAPILDQDGKPIKYISVRFPITERQQAEEELQGRAMQQGVLTVLSQEALASSNLTKLFERATNLVAGTLKVDYCLVLKLQPGGAYLTYEAGFRFKNVTKSQTIISARTTESLAGFVLASKEPVVIEDLTSESRFAGAPLMHDNNIVSGVGVIIHGQERPFGVLGIYTTSKRTFKQADIDFVQAVANLLANAARNQLDKRKDEFLGIASHELKTPLTSLKSFVQILQKHEYQQKDEQALLFLSKIDTQLNRLTDLINSLLDISRINAGKIEYKDETFKLSELVQETVDELKLVFKKHQIELYNKIKEKVHGDRYRIAQVLTNLLSNAIKYSPNGDKIIIKSEVSEDKVIVSVQDFGVGISEKDRENIFDRFFQGYGRKRQDFPGGLGLGLYICSEIIKRHQGQIWVESEEDKGSKFFFSLPIKRS